MKNSAKRIRNYILNLFKRAPSLRKELSTPDAVKALLPRSSFTKKGPGVREQLRAELLRLTQAQRRVAYDRGWDRALIRISASGKYRVAEKAI